MSRSCENARFSSTACLLRFEREVNARKRNKASESDSSKRYPVAASSSIENPCARIGTQGWNEESEHHRQVLPDPTDPAMVEFRKMSLNGRTESKVIDFVSLNLGFSLIREMYYIMRHATTQNSLCKPGYMQFGNS
jgi:hypothetical protein